MGRVGRVIRKIQWEWVRGGPGRTPRILTVPTANGLLSFSNMDLHNARTLYVQREWESHLIARSLDYLKREGHIGRPGADLLIDVGANVGMICIAMVLRGFFREAIAIEPDETNFALLKRNIEQNGLASRIRAFRCAISDQSGDVELEIAKENFGDHRVRGAHSLERALMSEEARATVRVPARTLDDLLAKDASVDPARVGLVWADIQGFEGYMLRGAAATLSHGAPVLSEVWPYGILRSGMDRDTYTSVARSLFKRIVIVDAAANRFEARDAADLPALFDTHRRPEAQLEILFLRE
ncbi:MAG: FkbM family methyltransferase [Candidatus Eiseniibacteriota bacterium]